MPEDASRRWMTYAEIATALNLPSAKAGEAKVRRAKWERTLGNDGLARVAVPLSVLEELHPLRRPNAEHRRNPYEGPVQALSLSAVLAELKVSHEQVAGELRRRAETAEARVETAEAWARQLADELATQHERAGRTEGERDTARAEAAALRAEVARLRDEVLAERERANTGLVRLAEAARLREAVVAERERANAALERAAEAEGRLAAGSSAARVLKACRAFLARRRGP